MPIRWLCLRLTLPGTRHFAILHGTGGRVDATRPRVWLLIELELRFENLVTRRSRWLPTSRSWVSRWPLRSGQWPKNGQNATSPITSYLSKLEPRFKDQNVPYVLGNTMRCILDPYGSFGGGGWKFNKIFFFVKAGISLWCILWPQWPHFDIYEWQMAVKFRISAPNYPSGHKNLKMTYDVLKGRPRKGHNISVNHGCHIATHIHVHITSKNTEVRKFQALKRYGTQISLDMTLEIKSQVKCHGRYGLKIFREGIKLFKG